MELPKSTKKAHLSCGQGNARRPQDFYRTHSFCTKILIQEEKLNGVVYDPSVGDGAITDVIANNTDDCIIVASDLYCSVPIKRDGAFFNGVDLSTLTDEELLQYFYWKPIPQYAKGGVDFLDTIQVSTFLDNSKVYVPSPENIVTNPPFNIGDKYIIQARNIATQKVCLFMKLNFIAGVNRYNKIYCKKSNQNFPLKKILIFPKRITFPGYSCSTTLEMAWFIWDRYYEGLPYIKHIDPKYYKL